MLLLFRIQGPEFTVLSGALSGNRIFHGQKICLVDGVWSYSRGLEDGALVLSVENLRYRKGGGKAACQLTVWVWNRDLSCHIRLPKQPILLEGEFGLRHSGQVRQAA